MAKFVSRIRRHSRCAASAINDSVAIVHKGLYTSDIGWGRGFYIVHETVLRQ